MPSTLSPARQTCCVCADYMPGFRPTSAARPPAASCMRMTATTSPTSTCLRTRTWRQTRSTPQWSPSCTAWSSSSGPSATAPTAAARASTALTLAAEANRLWNEAECSIVLAMHDMLSCCIYQAFL